MEEEGESALEEAAREQFGLHWWDRPALFRETAEAATDTDLPFWAVLLLSGAIATLGLALDATAVVIGAMLIAPLLGPVLGLGMALAVGDGRLAAQTALTVLLGVVGVVALAALLTLLLPFRDITPEIAARTRPTTLDLAIAVASGLAGAVVTLSREQRLSASIPGVAIAVALIPPLGVAGFGIGTGWQWPLIRGSLLLFGANLGGIVLSAMLAFLLVGMHREDVIEAARRWHREGERRGLAARIEEAWGFRRLRVFSSPWARVTLVLSFVTAVAFPLSTSLGEIAREARVQQAVEEVAAGLTADDRAFVLGRDVAFGDGATRVELRLATTAWIGEEERITFERRAETVAGEPVTLVIEQVPASAGDLEALASMLPAAAPTAPASEPVRSPSATLSLLQGQLADAVADLALPDSVTVLGAEATLTDGAVGLALAYAAPRPLPPEAETILTRQAARALGLDAAGVRATPVTLGPRPVPTDSATLADLADLLRRYPPLRLVVAGDSAGTGSTRRALQAAGAPAARLRVRAEAPPTRLLFTVVADSARADG